MTDPQIQIVQPGTPHQADWRKLYDGYATFYKRTMTDAIAGQVWDWLQDPAHELEGALALRDGAVLGLAHFRRMPSPLRGTDIGFLDDLFVDPAARGQGIADALFAHLQARANEQGWDVVRWITAEDNYRARALYDKLAKKTVWTLYEMTP